MENYIEEVDQPDKEQPQNIGHIRHRGKVLLCAGIMGVLTSELMSCTVNRDDDYLDSEGRMKERYPEPVQITLVMSTPYDMNWDFLTS